jgi:hypothetical protein
MIEGWLEDVSFDGQTNRPLDDEDKIVIMRHET